MRQRSESEIKLDEKMERIQRELMEFIRAEQVMIAAGIVSEAKVKQAHEIVRNLP